MTELNPWTNASFSKHKYLVHMLAFTLGVIIGFAMGIALAGFGV